MVRVKVTCHVFTLTTAYVRCVRWAGEQCAVPAADEYKQ